MITRIREATAPDDDNAAAASVAPAAPKGPGKALRRRRSPWPTRIAVAVVVVVVGVLLAQSVKTKPIVVETVAVVKGPVRDEISSSTAGEVVAERTATIRAELSGRVMAVKHHRGERVKKGDVVVALDAADLEARVRQAEATVVVERAQVAQSEAAADAATRTAAREQSLAASGAEPAKAAEDATAQARQAVAALQAAKSQVEQSLAALQVARVARGNVELTAPFDGLIADVWFDPGDEVQMGARVFEVVDDSRLHVEATIDEADIGRVNVGQAAVLRLDALPDRPVAGSVTKLDPTVRKDEKGARTLRLEVEVADLPKAVAAGIRPGMSANVDVRVAEKADVLSLPTNVVVGRGTKRSVYLVDHGVARQHTIEIGLSSWERTEITSGLKEGDAVVANLNTKGLADGVPVVPAGGNTP